MHDITHMGGMACHSVFVFGAKVRTKSAGFVRCFRKNAGNSSNY